MMEPGFEIEQHPLLRILIRGRVTTLCPSLSLRPPVRTPQPPSALIPTTFKWGAYRVLAWALLQDHASHLPIYTLHHLRAKLQTAPQTVYSSYPRALAPAIPST